MKKVSLQYECCCNDCGTDKWDKLMTGKRPCSYKRLVSLIKRDYPDMYKRMKLSLHNPYESMCGQTKTHYIFVHSFVEYFFRKIY